MKRSKKKIEIRLERRIPAAPGEVCEAWLNREVPGTPWNEGEKLILTTEVDGLFYWLIEGTPHYGRFTEIKKPNRIQHTWMSPYTFGEESMVTVTFKKSGEDTLMTLVHSGLPDSEEGRGHEKGWAYFLDGFSKQLGAGARKKK